MDADRFDRLARALAAAGSRRVLARVLATLPVAGALAAWGDDETATAGNRRKKRRKKSKKKKQCQGKDRAKVCAARCGLTKCNKQTIDCPCAAGQFCADGICVACDVCEAGCPFDSVQAAIGAADSGNTIQLCPGTFTLSESITVAQDLTLIGAGQEDDPAANTILDGAGAVRVIAVGEGVTVALRALRITGGNANAGGGLFNFGTLTLTACTVSGNAATEGGGGLRNNSGATFELTGCTVSENGATDGGGIFNNGAMTLTACTVTENGATDDGGGISNLGTLTLDDGASVTDNEAGGNGGGIFNDGAVAISTCLGGSSVSGNTAGDPPVENNCVAVDGGDCDGC